MTEQTNTTQQKPEVTYEDFAKLDMRLARVLSAELVEGADKLLKITLDVGELGERTIVSGIRPWYAPEDLIGKTIVYLANLAPRTLRGVESQGMLVAAGAEDAMLLHPDTEAAPGTVVR